MREDNEWDCLDCGVRFTEPAKHKFVEYPAAREWEHLCCPICGSSNLE